MISQAYADRDRTLYWGLLISALIHVVILAPFIRDLIPGRLFEARERPVIVTPLEFELVSPPERPTPSSNVSKYLSTVSSRASDLDRANDDSALPKSEGVIPLVDTPSPEEGSEGGGQQELPPLPEEQTSLGEAFERSRFTTQSSPRSEPSLPEANPEFRSSRSARASVGGISINTTAWDFAPYLLDLKQRIKQHWIPPLAFTALGAIHGYTRIAFRIYPDGSMEALEVLESKGHDSLHRASSNAIRGAAPFRRLPDDFPEEYLDVIFGFYYLLPGDEKEFFERK
ncbi:MAG: energy transducer TonB [Candidatus Krumholzibacteriia bacterium]